jgi:hypothetical protein
MMNPSSYNKLKWEFIWASGVTLGLAASLYMVWAVFCPMDEWLKGRGTISPESSLADEGALAGASPGHEGIDQDIRLLSSERRVVAYGSGYPIPYEAKTCPFSGTPQPEADQMDRDSDGMTDDWEIRFKLDKGNAADASQDADGDGFVNVEEFTAGTDPLDQDNHPSYVHKLRFIREVETPFPIIFQGYTQLGDGSTAFQLKVISSGKTVFAPLGDVVEGVELQRFEEGEIGAVPRLFVTRKGIEIELIRGETVPDPEKRAELINILDRSTIMVTMGALLSLHSDEYAVLGVQSEKVVVKHLETGEVFDIVGLADGER